MRPFKQNSIISLWLHKSKSTIFKVQLFQLPLLFKQKTLFSKLLVCKVTNKRCLKLLFKKCFAFGLSGRKQDPGKEEKEWYAQV